MFFLIECSSVAGNSSSYTGSGNPSTNNNVENNKKSSVNRNKSGKHQGTLNGHEWVDLGLPSGTLWATCNVGASKPSDYGDYYAWGETSTKEIYTENTYSYINHNVLLSSADPATVYWGKEWNMPTKEQWEELINNCEWTWTLNGYNVVGTNGNSIFLPAAGYRWGGSLNDAGSDGNYWSSSLSTDYPDLAWYLYFYSGYYNMDNIGRRYGCPVRPVCSVSKR